MTDPHPSAGDTIPPKCESIEVRVAELAQLFNAWDPSPFREKDLDPNAEEFIVEWARDIPDTKSLGLVVYLDRPAGMPEESTLLRDAVHEFFSHKAVEARQSLHQLFRVGRKSLVIGLACLVTSIAIGNFAANALRQHARRGDARELADRRLGRDVAAARDLLVRLVANTQ